MGLSRLKHYFPGIRENKIEQLAQLGDIYKHWNQKINVVSRKDIDQIFERHILHSLGISAAVILKSDTLIMDVGTGGGFPGIPLAIMHPDLNFHLVDSVGKKITVVNEVCRELNLNNVEAFHERAENMESRYDYIVTRAVMRFKPLTQLIGRKLKPTGQLLALKGGDLTQELAESNWKTKVYSLSDYFSEEFFETKKLIVSYR